MKLGRLIGGLRETLSGERPPEPSRGVEDALLFRASEKAEHSAETALSASQAAGASAAQQRSLLDAAVDGVKLLFSRSREARTSLAAAREALEQIRLTALNAGLEGARLGDPAGKPLVLVAEDIRAHAARAMSALEQHTSAFDQMDKDRDKLREQVESAQARTADVARDILQLQAVQRDVSTALADVSARVKHVTRTDPESARMVAEAADHARALVEALTALAARPQNKSLFGSLGPTLGPLIELMREQYRDESDDSP
ncbi:MAG: hypothetical protein IT377_19875 [Polyangiaceae bacterium]|nr:hypothetical protein [Myxococcales bacterium]MCC6901243.1 hypothetical protein [Polyangiaceae bacterium]